MGFASVECAGVGCRNYKPPAHDMKSDKLTAEYLQEFFRKVAALINLPTYGVVPTELYGCSYLTFQGFEPHPITFKVDAGAVPVEQFKNWVRSEYPAWAECL
jgi:hypothetical protein